MLLTPSLYSFRLVKERRPAAVVAPSVVIYFRKSSTITNPWGAKRITKDSRRGRYCQSRHCLSGYYDGKRSHYSRNNNGGYLFQGIYSIRFVRNNGEYFDFKADNFKRLSPSHNDLFLKFITTGL